MDIIDGLDITNRTNKQDIEDIPSKILNKVKIIFVSNYEEIYNNLFK